MTSEDHVETSEQVDKKDVLITPEGEELDQSITGTMKIDPAKHGGPSTNPDRIASIKYAIAGLLYVLKHEQSIRLASLTTLVVVIAGFWLEIPTIYWAVLTLSIGAIWITECLNTAIEAAINLETSEPHAMAKVGKDVAGAASLVSSIVFVIIVVLILVPRFIQRINAPGG